MPDRRAWAKYLVALVLFNPLGYPSGYPNGLLARLAELAFPQNTPATQSNCEQPGWFPTGFGLKDHAVFFHGGFTYIMSNYLPTEDRFAYARSLDWCNWEDLEPVFTGRTPGGPDAQAIWAPYVIEEDGTN